MEKIRQFYNRYRPLIAALLRKYYLRCKEQFNHYLPIIRDRFLCYLKLIRFDKPIGTFLLLWPALWALWIAAQGAPSLHLFLVFTLGVFFTRSAGVIINDFADRKFDLKVERTRDRPLTRGRVSTKEAFAVAAILLLTAFLLVLSTNKFTVYLSFCAVPLMAIYPYMKRHTYIPQFFLGLAFSWSIPMAFAAQTGSLPPICWLLFIANILWVVIFDTIYAMVDREDDLKIGIKSTAILFAESDRFIIGILQLMLLAVFIIIGMRIKLGFLYYGSLLMAAAIMIYHQILIKDRSPERCFRAFLHNSWLGAVVFAGISLNYLYN